MTCDQRSAIYLKQAQRPNTLKSVFSFHQPRHRPSRGRARFSKQNRLIVIVVGVLRAILRTYRCWRVARDATRCAYSPLPHLHPNPGLDESVVRRPHGQEGGCLLYTSDAADE